MSQRIDKLFVARDASPSGAAKGAESVSPHHEKQGQIRQEAGSVLGDSPASSAPSRFDFEQALRHLANAKSMRR